MPRLPTGPEVRASPRSATSEDAGSDDAGSGNAGSADAKFENGKSENGRSGNDSRTFSQYGKCADDMAEGDCPPLGAVRLEGRNEMNGTQQVDSDRFVAMAAAVTSAFGDPTRRDIYLYVRSEVGATAGDVAENFNLHPNVARHHLDKLAAGGHLETYVPRPTGSAPGRPSKHYRVVISADVAQPFSGSSNDLLVMLLCKALSTMSPLAAEELAQSVGETYGRTIANRISPNEGSRSLRSALVAVAETLTAQGFAANVEASGSTLAIIANKCPFGQAAVSHPVLCAVEQGLVKGMLTSLSGSRDTHDLKGSSRARGDAECCTRF